MSKQADRALQTSITFLQEIFGIYPQRDFVVRLWDGTVWGSESGRSPRFTLVLQHPGSLRTMFLFPGELSMSQAYIYDDCNIEGDIEGLFPLADHLLSMRLSKIKQLRYARMLLSLPTDKLNPHTKERAVLHGISHS